MGTQKLLLPLGKETIIERVIGNVLSSRLENIMVVLGANKDEIKEATCHLPVEYCYNEAHEDGMLSSVMCGIRSIPKDAGAALIYLGDQPGISSRVTDAILKVYSEELNGIIIPVYENRRGHPLLVDMKYRRDIEKLDLEQGLRSLMHLFPEDVLEVEVDEPGILVDIDTREDYSKATKLNLE
jgi:molybdenum cofactor cytidylyltransferase